MRSFQIDKLLETVVKERVSDLHITAGQPPVVRMGGHMVRLETRTLDAEDTSNLMKSITPERNQQELQERGGTDFGFAFGDKARFRVAVFKQRGMIGMVLRRIPNEFLTFEQLGLPPVIRDLIQRPRGLFLVTGPTGSGKTTSLASMINWMNHNMDHHIITLEDPIEYYHDHHKSTINQREIGVDVPSFPEALRRALRMDPDVILVGGNARPGNNFCSDYSRRNRARGLWYPAHHWCSGYGRPNHRRVPHQSAGANSYSAC